MQILIRLLLLPGTTSLSTLCLLSPCTRELIPIFIQIFLLKPVLNQQQMQLTIRRLANQLLEQRTEGDGMVLIGIQPRGIFLSNRIVKELQGEKEGADIRY